MTYGVSSPVADCALSLPMAAEWESENLAAILHRTTELFVDANLPGVSADLISSKYYSSFSSLCMNPICICLTLHVEGIS